MWADGQAGTRMHYECIECGKQADAGSVIWRCHACGGALSPLVRQNLERSHIDANQRSLWRYAPWLTYPGPPLVTLGEGWTPLVRQSFDGAEIYWKCDFIQPTGSFKDRGIAVMLNFLTSHGIASVAEDSSGNGGAALATYAAAASIPCRIYVPASTSAAKIAQISATGSEVVSVPGARQAVTEAAMNDSSGAYYASHNWHPMFSEGVKTVGFEIWEQLGFETPDVIIAPAGGGSNIVGCFRAFRDLVASGLAPSIPKLVGVQAANCEPLAKALRERLDTYAEIEPNATIAEGIALSRPVRAKEVLRSVRATGGNIISVSEADIRAAHSKLARRGFYVEPTSAAAAAGFSSLLNQGAIDSSQKIAVILTGSGLKTGALPPP
jgi:threonine synthase